MPPTRMTARITTGIGIFRQVVKHLVGPIGRLQHCGRDGGGQTDDTPGRKVGTGQDNTAANAQRDRQRGGRQADDVDQRADREEVRVAGSGKDNEDDKQDVDCVVEQSINDFAAFVPGIHRLEFRPALFYIGNCLHGDSSLDVLGGKGHNLFWVVFFASTSPARRPPDITRIRSHTPSSSGISDETIRMVLPRLARSRMSW